MAVTHTNSQDCDYASDPLYPWLLEIRKVLDGWKADLYASEDLDRLLLDCISTFKHNALYQNDIRFLKIWFLYLDGASDFEMVLKELEACRICLHHSLLYEWSGIFLEAKGKWQEAHMVYQVGISRQAEPLDRLKEAHYLFIRRMSERIDSSSLLKKGESKTFEHEKSSISPWSPSTMKDLLKKINPHITKYHGYHQNNKAYSGKVALSWQNSSRNKIVEIGGNRYQVKGCAGQGGFAQVLKAHVNCNPDEVVALKIQKPAFPWEFYIYRQLDQRISDKQRASFGFAHRVHLYSDCSILVCDYLSNGTLQDAINSYVVIGKSMEEELCIYYTIEMLYMLENLHEVGLIHGDFKPDNLLIRYSRDDLTEDGFQDRSGPWQNQGLCLVDWGKGLDLNLFGQNAEFEGDCRTSGFRCTEMQENRPWKFQADTYGLCVIVHMMLHNTYMEVQKKASSDGSYIFLPRLPFKRYWNVDLWKNLFTKLLNMGTCNNDKQLLQDIRESFQNYILSKPQLLKKLKELLAKQRASLCSA